MKKTIITAFVAFGFAALSAADSVSSLDATTNDKSRGGYTAFDFTLNNTGWLTPSTDFQIADSVKLTSIDLETAATWYTQNGSNEPLGIAIFKKVDNTWGFVAKSSWLTDVTSTGATGTPYTFAFSDNVVLSSSTKYTAVFYGHKETFDTLGTTSTLSSLAGTTTGGALGTAETPIVTIGLQLFDSGSASAHENLYNENGAIAAQNWAPGVAFNVKNIPEPATATLSLLALAGLAARRRK